MIVTQVISGLAQSAGGPSYSVPALAVALSKIDIDVRLRYVTASGQNEDRAELGSMASAHRENVIFGNVLKASQSLLSALETDAGTGALLHAHGLWLMPNLYPAWIKRRRPETLIVHSPRCRQLHCRYPTGKRDPFGIYGKNALCKARLASMPRQFRSTRKFGRSA